MRSLKRSLGPRRLTRQRMLPKPKPSGIKPSRNRPKQNQQTKPHMKNKCLGTCPICPLRAGRWLTRQVKSIPSRLRGVLVRTREICAKPLRWWGSLKRSEKYELIFRGLIALLVLASTLSERLK
jgi:hypothetical protein